MQYLPEMDEPGKSRISFSDHMSGRTEAIAHWRSKLSDKLPANTEDDIARWIVGLNVIFVIAKPRKTKLGDFRVSPSGKTHRISVNGNLNPYSFLITTVHEFAHLGCFLKHGNKVEPHGREWKNIYVELLEPFVERMVFPNDLTKALHKHMSKPKASSCTCPDLSPALAKYDNHQGEPLHSLGAGSLFQFMETTYRYVELRRTRVLCERISDGKRYLISKRAMVLPYSTSPS